MRYVLLTGGPDLDYEGIKKLIHDDDTVICADAGAMHARRMNIVPELIVGDMDSIDEETLQWAQDSGVKTKVYPIQKDQTDSEIALDYVPDDASVLFVLSLKGRIDHVLSNIMMTARRAKAGRNIVLTDGYSLIYTIIPGSEGGCELSLWPEDRQRQDLAVSIMPMFEAVHDVTTKGLYYPLTHATLTPGSSFSVSNKLTPPYHTLEVTCGGGVLCVIIGPSDD